MATVPERTATGERGGPTPGAPEALRVRAMFDAIAARYDLLNHVLSLQQDRLWRRRAARAALDDLDDRPEPAPSLQLPQSSDTKTPDSRSRAAERSPQAPRTPRTLRVLDLCCGTGDLALALKRRRPAATVFGADFSLPMLERARAKNAAAGLFRADALALPLRDDCLDALTVAFGVRNYQDRERGFHEALRVLRPGGRLVVLEFVKPPAGAFGALYRAYSRTILPRLGAWISRSRDAYSYLPESVAAFLDVAQLRNEALAAGFGSASSHLLALRTVGLIIATKGATKGATRGRAS